MPTGPMMSGASPAAIRVASVVAASVLSTTVIVRLIPGFASLNASTTACSAGICSSFSPVPSPTYHSISTTSPAGAASSVGSAPSSVGLTACVHADATRATNVAATPSRHQARSAPLMTPPQIHLRSTPLQCASCAALSGRPSTPSTRPPASAPARCPDDELRRQDHPTGDAIPRRQHPCQQARHLAPHLLDRLPHARQRLLCLRGERRVVEPNDRHVTRHGPSGRL